MVSCALVLVPLWIHGLGGGCRAEEPSREDVLSWFGGRVLEGLGLDRPPPASERAPAAGAAREERARHVRLRAPRTSGTWGDHGTSPTQDKSQIILFPSSDSSCGPESTRGRFSYDFQPSLSEQEAVVTAAHFWFYAGEGPNSSAPLLILPSEQPPLRAAPGPSQRDADGWTTYDLERPALASVARGPFVLQVGCPSCPCLADQPDKTPFLDLRAQPRARVRSRRHAPLNLPWSPSAIDLLQRPSQERRGDCRRSHVQISFEELGWDNWIVRPSTLSFYYCHGNCSAGGGTNAAAALGMSQCCAPEPGSMRSLRVVTTSDSGYSFRYETLPNLIPEACACV